MKITDANYFKVVDIETNNVYYIEAQEHCDILWLKHDDGNAGRYIFYKYPADLTSLEFTIWETKEVFYFTILEYSFDYGKNWIEVKR